jgi:hypothetical protein
VRATARDRAIVQVCLNARLPNARENPMPIPFVLAALLTAAAPDPMSAPIVAA